MKGNDSVMRHLGGEEAGFSQLLFSHCLHSLTRRASRIEREGQDLQHHSIMTHTIKNNDV